MTDEVEEFSYVMDIPASDSIEAYKLWMAENASVALVISL